MPHNGGKIYDIVLNEMNVPAQNSIFIDDNENNIKKASSKGFHTILYKDRESFEVALNQIVNMK